MKKAIPRAPRLKDYRQLPNAAFETDKISGEGYRVLAAVQYYDRGGINGRGCDAAVAKIAERALCDVRTVQRWLQRLVDLKLLDLEKRTGRGLSHIYRVIYSTDEDDEIDEKGDSCDTPLPPERVTAVTEKGDSALFFDEENQGTIPPNDTIEGYKARIHSPEGAAKNTVFDAYSLFEESRYPMAREAVKAFPADARGFVGDDGDINMGGFLSLMSRKANSRKLSSRDITTLQDIAALVMDNYECGSPEYGIASRLIDLDHKADATSLERSQ